jgi:hypothetical protein
MYEEEFRRIDAELKLHQQSNSKVVLLLTNATNCVGRRYHDLTLKSLASLTAGNIAATGGIAALG